MIRKLAITLLFLIGFIGINRAQNFEWAIQAGGTSIDQLRSATIDSEGNIYSTGIFKNNVDFDPSPSSFILSSQGLDDIFITKTDSAGNFIWAKRIGSSNGEDVANIVVDSRDNLYIVGFFDGTVDFDPGIGIANMTSITPSYYSIFLLKLDSDGNYLYAKQIDCRPGAGWLETMPVIKIDSEDNIVLAGTFDISFDADPGIDTIMVNTISPNQTFFLKLDSLGTYVWSGHIQSTALGTIVNDFYIDDNNNIISIINYNEGVIDLDPSASIYNVIGTPSSYNTAIVKLDSNGAFVWAKLLEGKCYSWAITEDKQSNIILSGYFNDSIDIDPGPTINNLIGYQHTDDIFLLKLDMNGNFIWARNYTGSGDELIYEIKTDSLNNIYVSGRFDDSLDLDPSLNYYPVVTNGAFDNFASKFDNNGQLIWAITYGGSWYDYTKSIILDNDLNIYLSGNFYYSVDFDPTNSVYQLNSNGGSDIFLFKLSQDSCSTLALIVDSALNYNCNYNGFIHTYSYGGFPPYSYEWNTNPPIYTSNLFPDTIGIYTITLTDSVGCQKQRSVLINGPIYTSGFELNLNLHAQNFRSSFSSLIWLDGFNNGCISVGGNLVLVLDDSVSFNYSIPPPDNISGDTLFWNFTNLIYDSLHITPVINVTTNAQIGDTVCFEVIINPIAGDADSSNNYKTYCFPVINGYDPNFKQVYPQGECIPNYVLNNEPLTYTIHFQNTGNADAINIHLLDTLDPNLNLNTLRVIGNSHDVITEILPGNVMNFRFDNIHLPDSGTNEIGSHGYVIYEVYPNTSIPNNTLIENTSYIYFDYNPAIITNTVFNTVVDVIPNCFLNVSENSNNFNFTIYPNPAKNDLTIVLTNEMANAVIEITNLQGQILQSISANSKATIIDISSLSNGLYFIRVNSEIGNSIYKFVKE